MHTKAHTHVDKDAHDAFDISPSFLRKCALKSKQKKKDLINRQTSSRVIFFPQQIFNIFLVENTDYFFIYSRDARQIIVNNFFNEDISSPSSRRFLWQAFLYSLWQYTPLVKVVCQVVVWIKFVSEKSVVPSEQIYEIWMALKPLWFLQFETAFNPSVVVGCNCHVTNMSRKYVLKLTIIYLQEIRLKINHFKDLYKGCLNVCC